MDGAIVWMVDQLQFHDSVASRTSERVAIKGLEEELSEGFAGEDAKAFGIGRHVMREDLGEMCSDLLIADITVQAVIANALEALWENVLNHTTDETKNGKVCIFDLSGTMVPVPVLYGFSVVVLNAAHGDGW